MTLDIRSQLTGWIPTAAQSPPGDGRDRRRLGTVHQHLDLMAREYETKMREPGSSHLEPLVNRWRAGWALARQWAGQDEALAAKDREIERLRVIIRQHLVDLPYRYPESYEPGGLARKLERGVYGR